MLPNVIFDLHLHIYALGIYAYLMRIEDRRTYQCVISYPALAEKLGISVNTVAKYVAELEEHGLIRTERTEVMTKGGLKRNGCLRYTILPIQNAVELFHEMKTNGRKVHRDTKGTEMAERSVRSCYHVIRMSLDRAIKDGLIKKNPILGCRLPPTETKEMKILSMDEIQRFLIQAKEEGMYELFLLELTTGLRRGEILALTWNDLNFKTGELRINKQIVPVGGKLITGEPKTNAAFRTIILPPAMVELLLEYRKGIFSPLMFPSRIKPEQPIDPSYVRKRLQVILGAGRMQKGAIP